MPPFLLLVFFLGVLYCHNRCVRSRISSKFIFTLQAGRDSSIARARTRVCQFARKTWYVLVLECILFDRWNHGIRTTVYVTPP